VTAKGVPSGDLHTLISTHFQNDTRPLGIAVSGGSDSLALLHLMAEWGGAPLRCVTVDHSLRAASAGEAAQVAAICAGLGVPHDTLEWTGWDGQGNLPAAARVARYALMAEWAQTQGLAGIALGHTADDVAETLLMRLARRAGVDGLAAMQTRRQECEVTLHRPLLQAHRADLRSYLAAKAVTWIDDPTNTDARYRRTQTRRALKALAPASITVGALSDVAHHLREASDTLGHYAAQEAAQIASFASGDLLLEAAPFAALRPDIARRILQAGLGWIAGPGYGARGPDVTRMLARLDAGQGGTLAGCRITQGRGKIRLAREFAAIAAERVPQGTIWDNRWHLDGPAIEGAAVGALGPEGRGMCDDWRDSGLPAHSVDASPALWSGETLVAAPLAGFSNGTSARLNRTPADLQAMLLSH